MEIALTVPLRWHARSPRRLVAVALAVACLAASALVIRQPGQPAPADPGLLRLARIAPDRVVPVIVAENVPSSDGAEAAVRTEGGTVTRELPLIHGFAARIDAGRVPGLLSSPAVSHVWGDAPLHMLTIQGGKYDSWAPNTLWRASIGLDKQKYTGAGVTVALLDTGVTQVPDLGTRVLERVDLTPDHDGYDRHGHGTHMAGIIASDGSGSGGKYLGVATKANLVSIKVAGWDGATDVSVVIAGLQWAVYHKAAYNIRVLNLSFGTDGTQSSSIDPLDYAVEQTWFAGIFVVVSAGNRGPTTGTINKPGDDPFVVTVGAIDNKNTVTLTDDLLADFSSVGPTKDGYAKPDVVAPGISIVSNLAPGSTVAAQHPTAIMPGSYIKGSGTSQATAVVSGVAALMFQANPTMTADVAKATLLNTSKSIKTRTGVGRGEIWAPDATNAALRKTYATKPANLGLKPSTGDGSLDGSRGTYFVYADTDNDGIPDTLISGDMDALGMVWDRKGWKSDAWLTSDWLPLTSEDVAWDKKGWKGANWSGMQWDDATWTSATWNGTAWDATDWTASPATASTDWGSSTWAWVS